MQTRLILLTALALTLPLAGALAQPILLRNDASTLAAATTNLAALDSGNTAGLILQPALVGDDGSWTPVHLGAPDGTAVINIPHGIAVTYNPADVVLVVTGAVPTQILGPALSGTELVLSFAAADNQSYTIERSDELPGTNRVLHTDFNRHRRAAGARRARHQHRATILPRAPALSL